MGGCCNEHGCRRKKPVKLVRSGLTGTWYVVTAYTDRGNGRIEALAKHALDEQTQEWLQAAFASRGKAVE
jgi:hypothetical protein